MAARDAAAARSASPCAFHRPAATRTRIQPDAVLRVSRNRRSAYFMRLLCRHARRLFHATLRAVGPSWYASGPTKNMKNRESLIRSAEIRFVRVLLASL